MSTEEQTTVINTDGADIEASPLKDATESLVGFDSILVAIDEFQKMGKALKKLVQESKISYNKEKKLTNKLLHKKKPRKTSDKPTGFKKPGSISPELATFLGVPSDHQLARTDVTNLINNYVMKHSLQNAKNRREFVLTDTEAKTAEVPFNKEPATKLRNLLKPDVTVTYFNLQKWLAPHFIKAPSVAIPDSGVQTSAAVTPPVTQTPVVVTPPVPPVVVSDQTPAAKKVRVRTGMSRTRA